MDPKQLKTTIHTALYIIEQSPGISVSRLRTYLIYLSHLGYIHYTKKLDRIFFKKLFNSKHVVYINRQCKDLGMKSGLYIKQEGNIKYDLDHWMYVNELLTRCKKMSYDELLERTNRFDYLYKGVRLV